MKETIKFANLPVFKEQWEKNLQKPIEVLEKPNEVVKIVDEAVNYDIMFNMLRNYFNNVDVIKIYSFIIDYETTENDVIVNSLEVVI